MKKEIKKLELQAITKIDEKGKMTAVASDESIDRAGDSIKTKDWNFEKWKQNPVLQAGHDYKPQYTIGIGKNIRVEGKKVLFNPVFHKITSLAREIGEMYKKGILKAWSVGFIPAQEEGCKHELLEISAVAVPANANALIVAKEMKSEEKKEVGDKIKEFVKKETSSSEDKKETKSPACRTEGESEKECVSRKIPEIMKENPDMKKDQVAAIAYSMCRKKCSEKEKDKKESKATEEKKVSIKKNTERWNKQLPKIFNKAFDIEDAPSKPATYDYELYTKYLNCKIKNVYLNDFVIPSPLLGSYLAGFKSILKKYKLVDERNFDWRGEGESPLVYETIKLNSKEEDDFLIVGTRFYKTNTSSKKFIVKFIPTWFGMSIKLISKTSERKFNKDILDEVHKWVNKNNKLKGEIFSLSGEFLEKTKDSWKDLVLDHGVKSPVLKSTERLKKKGKDANSRGLMFVGLPGTGKTKTGKVLMNDLKDSTFIWISSKDFKKLDAITALSLGFDLARKLAPSVLFLEDIDTWLRDYTIDLLKTEMDGLKENKGMITILTSNNPETLPDALLDRPGRFHDVLEFELPNKELRKEMIEKWTNEKIDNKILEEIATETKGYSGAHMKELVEFALMIKEEENKGIDEVLLESLEKIKKQRKLIQNIRNRVKTLELEIKEGRIISTKNRKIIVNAITINKQAITALEKLLKLTEISLPKEESKKVFKKIPNKGEGSDVNIKGRKSKKVHKELSSDELAVRTLKEISKRTNFALNQFNKDK